MKKLFFLIVFAIAFVNMSYSEGPEVSEKQDVSVFGVYSSYNMPSAAVMYFDDQMIGIFNSMKRFKVIGYQYRLDDSSAVKFIEHIKSLKEQKALKDQRYLDEDLGVVIIPGAEFDKLVNSFFIIIPSVSGWRITEAKVQKQKTDLKGNVQTYYVLEQTAEVSVSIKILDAEGSLMDVYNATETKKSEKGAQDAYRKAIDSALGGLNLFLRKTDQFKLKTKVLQNLGSKVYLQLGKDLGVKPGYEFVLKKKMTIGEGFTTSIDAGLVRVSTIGDNYSVATILKGAPQANDQLIESAMAGGRFNIYAGVVLADPGVSILNISGEYNGTATFSPNAMGIDLGIAVEAEIGYSLLSRLAIGMVLNSPSLFYADLGLGYELYLGSFSLAPELDLSAGLIAADLGGNYSLGGLFFGIKPKVSLNIQISQKFKFRLYGGYSLYFAGSGTVSDGSDNTYDNITFSNGSVSSQNLATIFNMNGLNAGAELVFRF